MFAFYFKKYKMYVAIAAQSVALSLSKRHGVRFNRLRRIFTGLIMRSVGAEVKLIGTIDADTDILIVNHPKHV